MATKMERERERDRERQRDRERWFGHVERTDDNDWVTRCIRWEVEGIRERTPDKTW